VTAPELARPIDVDLIEHVVLIFSKTADRITIELSEDGRATITTMPADMQLGEAQQNAYANFPAEAYVDVLERFPALKTLNEVTALAASLGGADPVEAAPTVCALRRKLTVARVGGWAAFAGLGWLCAEIADYTSLLS
jgi:hypothetical protein